MSTKAPAEKPTIKAVLAYAQTLRQRGGLQIAKDPWAKPYQPSEAVARKLCVQHGPDRALEILAMRASMADKEYREEAEIAKRSLERHKRRTQHSDRDREQQKLGLTAGQRLDRALAAFSVVPAVSAAQVGWSTKGSDRPSLTNHGDPSSEAKYLALKAVREIETLLERHKRRDIDKAA
jgi:hypothetical protein